MTYVELVDEINAFWRRHKAVIREQERLRAEMDYQLAGLIGSMLAGKFPKSLKSAYPDLFDTPGDWRAHKASFKQYAEEFNRQRGEKGK